MIQDKLTVVCNNLKASLRYFVLYSFPTHMSMGMTHAVLSTFICKPQLNMLNKRKRFLFFCHFLGLKKSNKRYMISSSCALIFHTTPMNATVTLHVYLCFAHPQLCIGNFVSRLLRRHPSLIAKVNSCISYRFCITTMLCSSEK